jgi:hypothetical protein
MIFLEKKDDLCVKGDGITPLDGRVCKYQKMQKFQ